MNNVTPAKRKPGRPARFLFIKTVKGRDFYLDRKYSTFRSVPAHGICTERSKREGYVKIEHSHTSQQATARSLARAAHRLGFLTATTYYTIAF